MSPFDRNSSNSPTKITDRCSKSRRQPMNDHWEHSSANVVSFHKEIQRKGRFWKAGLNIKILKGTYAGCHKNNVVPPELSKDRKFGLS